MGVSTSITLTERGFTMATGELFSMKMVEKSPPLSNTTTGGSLIKTKETDTITGSLLSSPSLTTTSRSLCRPEGSSAVFWYLTLSRTVR